MNLIQPDSARPLFAGEFRHSLDGKSRVTIPSSWRFEEEAELFLMLSSNKDCVKALPRVELDRVQADAALKYSGVQLLEIQRTLGARARQCWIDKAGRLVVPDDFCKRFALAGEVVLVGAMKSFEIWNVAEFEIVRMHSETIATPCLADLGL